MNDARFFTHDSSDVNAVTLVPLIGDTYFTAAVTDDIERSGPRQPVARRKLLQNMMNQVSLSLVFR